jgi:hypothetical protein
LNHFIDLDFLLFTAKRLTVCVTCVWAGVDSVWEQKKLEARKMLENAAESHTSGARFVSPLFVWQMTSPHSACDPYTQC